jgi:hypothetical protein
VGKIACEHQYLAVAALLSHNSYHGRSLGACNRRGVERHASTVHRQLRRKDQHVARDVLTVGGEQAVIVRVHALMLDAPRDGLFKIAMRHRIEIQQLPVHYDIGFVLHDARHGPADESDQQHDGKRKDHRIDSHQPECR